VAYVLAYILRWQEAVILAPPLATCLFRFSPSLLLSLNNLPTLFSFSPASAGYHLTIHFILVLVAFTHYLQSLVRRDRCSTQSAPRQLSIIVRSGLPVRYSSTISGGFRVSSRAGRRHCFFFCCLSLLARIPPHNHPASHPQPTMHTHTIQDYKLEARPPGAASAAIAFSTPFDVRRTP
jgi:hypothetical protein